MPSHALLRELLIAEGSSPSQACHSFAEQMLRWVLLVMHMKHVQSCWAEALALLAVQQTQRPKARQVGPNNQVVSSTYADTDNVAATKLATKYIHQDCL